MLVGACSMVENLTKGRVRTSIIGKSKIGMVEEIEKLEADTQHTIFPMGDLRVFHDREVRVEVARSTETVAALRESHARTAARTLRTWQVPGVESRLATCLQKQVRLDWVIHRPALAGAGREPVKQE